MMCWSMLTAHVLHGVPKQSDIYVHTHKCLGTTMHIPLYQDTCVCFTCSVDSMVLLHADVCNVVKLNHVSTIVSCSAGMEGSNTVPISIRLQT
jgi:hypothetical protein